MLFPNPSFADAALRAILKTMYNLLHDNQNLYSEEFSKHHLRAIFKHVVAVYVHRASISTKRKRSTPLVKLNSTAAKCFSNQAYWSKK